jgi:hypothetical protein
MSEEAFSTPYTRSPGSSTPGSETTPAEGKADLWGLFWLALLNTGIVAAAGIGTWWFVH